MTLKDLREALGIPRKRLDRLAGLAEGTVGAIEEGKNRNPTVLVASAIVEALKGAGAKGADIDTVFAANIEAEQQRKADQVAP